MGKRRCASQMSFWLLHSPWELPPCSWWNTPCNRRLRLNTTRLQFPAVLLFGQLQPCLNQVPCLCCQAGTGDAVNFRFTVNPKNKVSVFSPNDFPANTDKQALRATWMGALFKNQLDKIPQSDMGSVLWEAPL